MDRFLKFALIAFATVALFASCQGETKPPCERDACPALEACSPDANGLCDCESCDCYCRGGTSPVCSCLPGTCDCPCESGTARSDRPSAVGAPSGIECPHELLAGDVPAEVREFYRNLTMPGSCVQCSIGMCGCAQNVENASLLLWQSEYGPAELHGSWPQRTADYARKRKLAIWNVTGVEHTYDFMRWACRNGRPCAITCNRAHFQTLLGHDPAGPGDADDRWFVVDNNSPQRIDVYSDAEFRRRHEAMGPAHAWCVVLDSPPAPPRPEYAPWWEAGASALRERRAGRRRFGRRMGSAR